MNLDIKEGSRVIFPGNKVYVGAKGVRLVGIVEQVAGRWPHTLEHKKKRINDATAVRVYVASNPYGKPQSVWLPDCYLELEKERLWIPPKSRSSSRKSSQSPLTAPPT